jgi:transcriptional antiterminator NusG
MIDTATDRPAANTDRHKWYIVHAYSNFEKKVAEAIRDQAQDPGAGGPLQRDPGADRGRGRDPPRQKVNSERKFFPGYVLVKMELTDEAFHLIKNTPKVTGFLGSGSKPIPVSEKEVQRIIGAVEEGAERAQATNPPSTSARAFA